MNHDDPTDIRGQERAQAEQERRRRLAVDTEKADWKWLMGSKRGRRIVRRWLEDAGALKSSFDVNPQVAAFLEGRAAYPRKIVETAAHGFPELYVLMQQEHDDDNRKFDDGRSQ
jgi:hypothetical protein